MTPQRLEKLRKVASLRTRKLALVLEDVRHPHNISACMRSAEAFGIQNIHVVEGRFPFVPSSVTRGVDRWVDLHRWQSSAELSGSLKSSGYKIACAYPRPGGVSLDDLPVDQPLALVFGNEGEGLSTAWEEWADLCFTIPMVGMVESLNISVSCALSLRAVANKMIQHSAKEYHLSDRAQVELVDRWILAQQRRSREVEGV